MGVEFDWDDKKDGANQRKHRVSFALASEVFLDEHGRKRSINATLKKSAGLRLAWSMGVNWWWLSRSGMR